MPDESEKRMMLATFALMGMLSSGKLPTLEADEKAVKVAYKYADALIAEAGPAEKKA